MRLPALALALAATASAAGFVHAVEFPYSEFPRPLWERELVWLRNVGIRTVVFSVPARTAAGDPRADLPGLLRLLRRLEMRAWIRSAPRDLAASLQPQLAKHGGPIAYSETGIPDAPAPPAPVVRLSATDPRALLKSREALARAPGSLVWQDVEDTLAAGFRAGVVSFHGEERAGVSAIRRNVALLNAWAAALPKMKSQRPFKGKLSALQVSAPGPRGPSALVVTNAGNQASSGDLHAFDASAKRKLIVPAVGVAPGETLWLPVNVALASSGFCEDCAALAPQDRIVYATAELNGVEYENGILALEFAAPLAGAAVLQLSRKPTGPLLAGGKPTDFEWDEEQHAVRLPVPAGKAPLYRTRIGLALEPPDQSGFFGDPAQRLLLDQVNLVPVTFSSEELAGRARLVTPLGFHAKAVVKSPLEIEYELTPPAEAVHGVFIRLALEADGVHLAHARMQVLRKASLRFPDTPALHFGVRSRLSIGPPAIPIDARSGRSIRVLVRNHSPAIQNFVLEASGDGLTFTPARIEVSVAGKAERELSLRAFADAGAAGLREAKLKLSGAAAVEETFRILPLPRGQTVAYSLDRDGDGAPDWVLENQQTRATFSGADGRWMEWVWKDGELNLLPENGALPMAGPVLIKPATSGVEITAPRSKRRISLRETLEIEQDAPLATGDLKADTRDGIGFQVERPSAGRAVFSLRRAKQP